MDIFKNPIVIGLTFGVITYSYLQMTVNEKNEKNKKSKKNKNKDNESVNLLIPLVVSIIAWFIAYAYFEYSGNGPIDNSDKPNHPFVQEITKRHRLQLPLPLPPSPKYGFVQDELSGSSEPRSFSLINAEVTVPTKLPDVLLEMY